MHGSFDWERFEETAGMLEFDEGMTRFEAETEAARRQGVQRWEAMKCEQRMKYFGSTASASGASKATSGRPARNAAHTGGKSATHASPSRSNQMASSGVAGTAA